MIRCERSFDDEYLIFDLWLSMSTWNTQRVMDLHMDFLDIWALIVNPVTDFFRDELLEFFLHKTDDSCLDTSVNF